MMISLMVINFEKSYYQLTESWICANHVITVSALCEITGDYCLDVCFMFAVAEADVEALLRRVWNATWCFSLIGFRDFSLLFVFLSLLLPLNLSCYGILSYY